MNKKISGCDCCSECTNSPDCKCNCPDCTCGCCTNNDCCCGDDCDCRANYDCCCVESKFLLSAVSSIMGMIFMGVFAVLFSIAAMNTVWDLTTFDAYGYTFMLFCVAAALALAGIISLKAGDMTEGILFSLTGFTMAVVFGGALYGYEAAVYMEWILAAMLLVIAFVLLAGRDTMFGIAVSMFFAGLTLSFVSGQDLVTAASGITFLISGVILMYVAISDWMFVEEGIDLPKI
ncbi:MAG: hypothetical protein FWD92_01200 [Methanomassiliicoccaceae archaeon]|nr:hypothetical protein [Methanomassiliicoccaceae archaeon]